MKKHILLLLFISSFGLHAQNELLNFTDISTKKIINPNFNIVDKGLDGLTVSYQISTAHIKHKEINNSELITDFQLLTIQNFSYLQNPGQAALPSKIEYIAVPQGADYELEIKSTTSKIHKGYKIYPAREPARDTEGAPEPPYVYDEKYYSTDAYFPAKPIEIIETIIIRGLTYLVVQITPIQYNPARSEIKTNSEITFDIKFSGAKEFMNYQNHSNEFIQTMLSLPLNSEGFKSDYDKYKSLTNNTSNEGLNIDYLIITQDALLSAADSLAFWKRKMGYGVEIISAPVWTAAGVKTTIYNKYHSLTPKPDYFVIIGDVQQVPADMFAAPDNSGNYGTDLYYACMDGGNDYVPEMAHGRISVNSLSQAIQVIQKMVNYERNPIQDTSFYKNGVNCAQFQDDDLDGFADRRFTHTSEDVRDYLIAKGYNVERIYYTDNNVMPLNYNAGYYSNSQPIPSVLLKTNGFNWSGGANDIKNSINAGKFYVLHRDHGFVGGTGWAHPYFISSNISTLTNGNKLPVVFSINCHTGEFTLNSCFAETFLRQTNGGAVGVFGASYYSYSGYNDGLTAGLFDAIWSDPGLIPVFGSGGFSIPTVTNHSDITNMGMVLNQGLLRMRQTWSGNNSGNVYTYRLFHYFGDPAMRMWTKQPTQLTATHATSINCTDSTFAITSCNDTNAIATLTSNGQLLGKGIITNGSGLIKIPLVLGQNLLLTITARDRIPYFANITVNSGGGLSLFAQVENNICFGDSIGTIRVQPSCGNPPYQISWADGSIELFRDSLVGGNYIITITDSSNNTLIDTLQVWSPSAPLTSSPVVLDAKCFFESSGRIDLNLTGGATPYNYNWNNGSTSAFAPNLAAGNYTVTVTDSAGCTFNSTFTISQPTALDLTTNFTDDTTNNCSGTGLAIATGGVLPYSFSWNDPANQTTPLAIGLCKGLFKVTLTDSNNCKQYRTIIISNTVSIEDENINNSVSLYPNPAKDKLIIKFEQNNLEMVKISIYDAMGRKLFIDEKRLISNNEIKIDLKELNSGIYFIQLDLESGNTFIKKVIIENQN